MPDLAGTETGQDDPPREQPPPEALEPKFLPPPFAFTEPCDAR